MKTDLFNMEARLREAKEAAMDIHAVEIRQIMEHDHKGGLIGREEVFTENVELSHFLAFEIMQSESRMRDENNPFFNGVFVGKSEAQELQRKHISFCKQLLRMIEGTE